VKWNEKHSYTHAKLIPITKRKGAKIFPRAFKFSFSFSSSNKISDISHDLHFKIPNYPHDPSFPTQQTPNPFFFTPLQ